jgi:hypothetical protein
MSPPTARTVIFAEDVLVLALLEARATATSLLIALHNLTATPATAQKIETATAMCATGTEKEIATVIVREKRIATRIVTEIVKRTAIEIGTGTEKENAIATETATVAAETTKDQRPIATSPPPAPVPLAGTARSPSASVIVHAREAAMLGRTATSFASQRGCLGAMKTMRCLLTIEHTALRGYRESMGTKMHYGRSLWCRFRWDCSIA